MSDISFAELSLEANDAITASGNLLTIDVTKLMGEATIALTDRKVAEFLTNLLDAAHDAQVTYNADTANTRDIESYGAPTSGIPVRDATTGEFSIVSNYTFSSEAPLDKSRTRAVLA
jgi:hypothetical protein